jgi:hypothetical protein
MPFFMKLLFTICIIGAVLNCKGQSESKTIKFDELGWTLHFPGDSKLLDNAQFDTIKNKKLNEVMEKGSNLSAEKDRTIFIIHEGRANYFGSTISLYDSSFYKTWEDYYSALKKSAIKLIEKQSPNIKIGDSLSSKMLIDSLPFEELYLKTSYTNIFVLHSYWFCRRLRNYVLSINVAFTDDDIGQKYLTLLKNSKFDK